MTIYGSENIVERCLRWFERGFGREHTGLILQARQNLPDLRFSGFQANTAYNNYSARDGQPPADPDLLSWTWNWVPRESASLVVDEPLSNGETLNRLIITFVARRPTPTIEISDLKLANCANHWVMGFVPDLVVRDCLGSEQRWIGILPMQIFYHQVDPPLRHFTVKGAFTSGEIGCARKIEWGNFLILADRPCR